VPSGPAVEARNTLISSQNNPGYRTDDAAAADDDDDDDDKNNNKILISLQSGQL
jgi:hypothetical protein